MKFYCDKCGTIINRPEEGMVEWIKEEIDGKKVVHSFKIVHNPKFSPLPVSNDYCYHHENALGRADMHLHKFLEYKHQYLASFLDLGFLHDPDSRIGCRVQNFKEFAHFMRRITIPKYDEASLYFEKAKSEWYLDGENELGIFADQALSCIIENCKEQ